MIYVKSCSVFWPLDKVIPAYNLNNPINEPTCSQSNYPTCINLIFTSKQNLFNPSNIFRNQAASKVLTLIFIGYTESLT